MRDESFNFRTIFTNIVHTYLISVKIAIHPVSSSSTKCLVTRSEMSNTNILLKTLKGFEVRFSKEICRHHSKRFLALNLSIISSAVGSNAIWTQCFSLCFANEAWTKRQHWEFPSKWRFGPSAMGKAASFSTQLSTGFEQLSTMTSHTNWRALFNLASSPKKKKGMNGHNISTLFQSLGLQA